MAPGGLGVTATGAAIIDVRSGPLHLRGEAIHVAYRDPFRIARSEGGEAMTSVIVELRHADWPDLVGYGEGYPDAYYGETVDTIAVVLAMANDDLDRQLTIIEVPCPCNTPPPPLALP